MRYKLLMMNRTVHLHRSFIHILNVKQVNKLTTTADPFHSDVTEIIDVRSPDEYKMDHIPKAINFPVLDNIERHQVGQLYSTNQFDARKVGAALVISNIKEILEKHVLDKDQNFKPMVYCWRGGQRSRSLGTILSEIGFEVYILEGGYRTYRRKVRDELSTLPDKFKYHVISGLTGTGKSHILSKLSESGQQVLDLEFLAKHKGSMLGRYPNEEQPSQKYFETLLLEKLMSFDQSKIVWMESESSKIGKCTIPQILFKNLCHAKRFCVNLPIQERVRHIIRDYPYMLEDDQSLLDIIEYLKRFCGKENAEYWKSLVNKKEWETFVESILTHHYDPTYTLSQCKNQLTNNVVNLELSDLSDQSLSTCVSNLLVM